MCLSLSVKEYKFYLLKFLAINLCCRVNFYAAWCRVMRDACPVAEKYGADAPSPTLVHASREPLTFTNIFPFWQTDTSDVSDSRVGLAVQRVS